MRALDQLVAGIVLALLLTAAQAAAQGPQVEAVAKGAQRYDLSIVGKNESALDYLSAIAAACRYELDVTSPELGSALAVEHLDLNLSGRPGEEIIDLIATACGLVGRVDLENRRITIDTLPADEDPEAGEFFRERALHAVFVAYGGDETPEDKIELLLRSARLHLAGNDYQQAFDSYDSFMSSNASHPLVPEAAIGAAYAALMVGRHADVQRVVQSFADKFPTDHRVGRAEIIAARSRLSTGDIGGGVALLKNLIRRARNRELDQRDGIVAEFLLAETLHQRAEDEQALRVLEEAEIRYDRKYDADLLKQVRLYMAICRESLGNTRDALHDLELAVYEIPGPELKVRAMLFHAQLLLEAGDPMLALFSARVALRFEPTGHRRFEARRSIGRALHGLQLEEQACAELLAAVLEAPTLLPDTEVRRREVSQVLREMGSIYLSRGLYRDAIASFEAVINAAEHQRDDDSSISRELVAECRYLIALSHYKAGAWKSAIETLAAITEGVSSESLAHDIRRLKGDCYFASGMPEPAMRVWNEGEAR